MLDFAVGFENRGWRNIGPFVVYHGKLKEQGGLLQVDFEPMVKRAALLANRSALGRDAGALGAVVELGCPVLSQLIASSSRAAHCLWHTEEESNKVGIVYV